MNEDYKKQSKEIGELKRLVSLYKGYIHDIADEILPDTMWNNDPAAEAETIVDLIRNGEIEIVWKPDDVSSHSDFPV